MPTRITAIKHYELHNCLGEGGFGAVFEAWDTKLQRKVAIKRLKQAGPSNNHLLREARLAASLQHAAFVKIHALEEDDDSQSIVMELVHGQTLKQLLATRTPSEADALAIVKQIAQAMEQAHAAGLTHGDLKPSNIMVEPSGAVRILDFGLASQTDAQATLSSVQHDTQGTIAYMAPERLLGAALAPQADIYALGVMLYELTTGARPFAQLNGFALAAAQMQSSSDAWNFPSDMSVALSQFIRKMTAKLPIERFATMNDVLLAFDNLEHSTNTDSNSLNTIKNNATLQSPITNTSRKKIKINRNAVIIVCALFFSIFFIWTTLPFLKSVEKTLVPFSESQEMKKGLDALDQWDRPGSLDEAIQHFNLLIEHNAENAAAIAGLSIAYNLRYQGDTYDDLWSQKSLASAQQAMQLNPHLSLSQLAMGKVLFDKGNIESADDFLKKAIQLDPQNTLAWSERIEVFQAKHLYDEGLDLAKECIKKFPQNRIFYNQIGKLYVSQGKYAEAEQAFRESIRIQPDSVYAYANLGATLQYMGRDDDALHTLQQGLTIRPSAWLYTNLGNAYFFKGEYLDALSAFEAAVSPQLGNAGDYLGWTNLADTLLWIPGKKQEAQKYYAKARSLLAPLLKRYPDDEKIISRMALYNARLGDREACKTLLDKLLIHTSNAPDLHFRRGLAYELIGERALALEQINIANTLGYPLTMIEAEPDLENLRRDPDYKLR